MGADVLGEATSPPWVFLGASVLLLFVAILARGRQAAAEAEVLGRLGRFFGRPPDPALARRLRRGLPAGEYSGFVALLVVLFVLYALLYGPLGLPEPYLADAFGPWGRWTQLAVSLVFWAPAIALGLSGLSSARRYRAVVLGAFRQREREAAELGRRPPPGVFSDQANWFFNRFAAGFLRWGIVAGLILTLVLVVDETSWVRVAASLLAVALLADYFLLPMYQLARSLARIVHPIEVVLAHRLGDVRLAAYRRAVGEGRARGPDAARTAELRDLVASLPPASTFLILWKQYTVVAVGLLGPFIAVMATLVNFF